MPEPGQKIHLPVNNQLVRLVSGKAFEEFVKAVYPTKIWKFPHQTSPVFVPSASSTACKICEEAVEAWLKGINGKHYHVSATALVRHFTHRGLIPEGHYLVVSNPKMYGERLSDESAYGGKCKGVF